MTPNRNAHSSVGKIIAVRARDGLKRYAIYTHVQPCDLAYRLPQMLFRLPIVDVVGAEPTHARNISALGGHQWRINKSVQVDTYTIGAFQTLHLPRFGCISRMH